MLDHNGTNVPASLFEGFQSDDVPHEAIDELTKTLIAGYERAREKGLAPNGALTVMLAWAASECERLQREFTNAT